MKRILSFLLITLLFATTAWSAKTAQAIWTEGNTTLTFTYEEPVSVGGYIQRTKSHQCLERDSGYGFKHTRLGGPLDF